MPVTKHGSAAEAAAAMGQVARGAKERSDEFFMLVGHCIAEWATVDEALFEIFGKCVGPYEQAAIIYYRTPGLDVRLNLVDEIVKSVLPKRERKSGGHDHPLVKQWGKIVTDAKELLSIRRRIAHQPVEMRLVQNWLLYFTKPELFQDAEFGSELYRIQATAHERLREKETNASPLLLKDLKNHIMDIGNVFTRLWAFREKLIAHVQSSSEPAPPQNLPEYPA